MNQLINNLELIKTKDGSLTLFNKDLQETYHSRRGALAESQYVFIQNGLQYFVETNPNSKNIRILEIGFGTGLNIWLTWLFSQTNEDINIQAHSLEPFPLNQDIVNILVKHYSDEKFQTIHQCSWNEEIIFTDKFSLFKDRSKLSEIEELESFDIIYHDGFAPSVQEELWNEEAVKQIQKLIKTKGILITYSATSKLKKLLIENNFKVELLPGALGKREMIRAIA